LRVLLISDVHGNIDALEAVLKVASYDEALFVGDAVDYGPFPLEAFSRLRRAGAKAVLGNHDAAASFGIDCRSSPAMYAASVVTRRRITLPRMPKAALKDLGKAARKLDTDYGGFRVRALHASPSDELYQYITKEEAAGLKVRGTDLLVVGHTHVHYEVKKGGTWVVNPGSVGMPKDGDPGASYAVLDTQKREVRFERARYDPEPMLSELRKILDDSPKIYELLAKVFRTGK